LLARPRRGFDLLKGDIFSALRSFVLLAPPALSAQVKGWKLTTALHAICHERFESAAR
jgi:hypothetical protein